ncbi:MAG: hypothetical protein A2Y24_05615 [Clostridiales bacterium GWE2_32_10]|nr:MAG: hypothetical protein A2Y24_05615 [Clostridiales bacterium GWE2_32_10]
MLNRTKTYILFILIIIAICQMFELWFDDYSNRNFFYSVITSIFKKSSIELEYKYKLEPNQVVISFGKTYTVLQDSEEAKKKIDSEVKKIFNVIVSKDIYVTEENVNMKEFLENMAVLYEYPVRLENIVSINPDYDESNKNVREIGEFNKIILQPSNSSDDSTNCYFIDDQTGIAKKVKIAYNSKVISDEVNFIQYKTAFKKYSTTEYGSIKKYFFNINFLPDLGQSNIIFKNETIENSNSEQFDAYKNVILKNPFLVNNVVDENKMEEYVNCFFENPFSRWNFKKQNGVTVYSDGEKLIKFMDSGFIEYTNSKKNERDTYLSFATAYQIARTFMEKDNKYMYSNLYLMSANKNGNSEWSFGFEFKLDDYRYIIQNGELNNMGIKYPVEIIVKNDHVYSYKRLIKEFEVVSNDEIKKIKTYNEVFDSKEFGIIINNKQQNRKTLIKNMFLAYYSENIRQNPKLMWIIETADKVYAIDAADDKVQSTENKE